MEQPIRSVELDTTVQLAFAFSLIMSECNSILILMQLRVDSVKLVNVIFYKYEYAVTVM